MIVPSLSAVPGAVAENTIGTRLTGAAVSIPIDAVGPWFRTVTVFVRVWDALSSSVTLRVTSVGPGTVNCRVTVAVAGAQGLEDCHRC